MKLAVWLSTSCVIFLFAFSNQNFAQKYPDKKVDSLWVKGIDYLVDENYTQAKNVFSRLDVEFPQLPLGKIYLAATEIVKAYDYGVPYNQPVINMFINDALKLAENNLKKKDDLWNNYFIALVKAYDAYYQALQKEWISAFTEGYDAIGFFERCQDFDPSFHESSIAVGNFKYWKSRKTEFLNWLPFLEDETQAGIDEIKKAVKFKTYNSFLATNSLIWIYIDRAEYQEAIKLAADIIKQHPQNRFFRWPMAQAYESIDKRKAISTYQEIIDSFSKNKIKSNLNVIILKHKIAQLYVKLGEKQKALKLCDEILAVKDLTPFEADNLEERLERVKKLQQELKEESGK